MTSKASIVVGDIGRVLVFMVVWWAAKKHFLCDRACMAVAWRRGGKCGGLRGPTLPTEKQHPAIISAQAISHLAYYVIVLPTRTSTVS